MSVFLIAGIWVSASVVLTPLIGILLQKALRDPSGALVAHYDDEFGALLDPRKSSTFRTHAHPTVAIFAEADIGIPSQT